MDNTILNLLWVEKYRPRNIDQMILTSEVKIQIKQMLQLKDIPHLLFLGPPGSGKTSLARIIVDGFSNENILFLNGSSETGVDTVRDKIESFLSVKGFNDELKIIFIDEFDYMSQNAQACIRNVMDHYVSVGRFLCTANFQHKIIEPLVSRFHVYKFESLPLDVVEKHVFNILNEEKVKYDIDDVRKVINSYYPDVRQIINILNSLCVNNTIQLKKENIKGFNQQLIEKVILLLESLFKHNRINDFKNMMLHIEEFVVSNANKFQFPYVYEAIFKQVDHPVVKITVVDYLDKDKKSLFPYINFIAFLWNVYVNYQKMSAFINNNLK